MSLRTVIPVRIPDAAYDAIMLALSSDPTLMPHCCPHAVGPVQHVLVWVEPDDGDVAIALVRGEEIL